MNKPELHIKKIAGPTVILHDRHIRPVGRVVIVKWSHGALLWHRPSAVEIRQGERVQWLPISNTTRRTIIGMTLAGLLLGAVAWLLLRSRHTFGYV